MKTNVVYRGDCLAVMQEEIADGSIDMILCDLPYGVTRNKWDEVIPFDDLWKQYKRIIKPNGAILLFADGMFMAKLMVSNPAMWRYNLVWKKGERVSGFLNANKMPLRNHEEICVFYKALPTYNPQFTEGIPLHGKGNAYELRYYKAKDIRKQLDQQCESLQPSFKPMIYAGVEDVIRELGKEAAEELTFSSIQKQPEQETENEQGQEPEQHQGEDHEKHANHQRTDCFER